MIDTKPTAAMHVRDTAKHGDPAALPQLVEGGGVVRVIKAIQEKYGFTPTAAYVTDLIAFVETLTHGDA